MKAIEAMEKAEQRKKDTTGTESGQTPTGTGNAGGKRRRSSSSYRNSVNAFDSNVEASSADESKPEPKRNRKRGRSKYNYLAKRFVKTSHLYARTQKSIHILISSFLLLNLYFLAKILTFMK